MRAAQANHYRDHQEILQYALASSPTNPQVESSQIPRLAAYMRNTVVEISQLSGISRSIPKQGQEWKILGEWMGKSTFLQFRHAPICPKCLQEAAYLRGEWHLAFNTACWQHGCQLIERCPQCRRQLGLERTRPEYCCCQFDLRTSKTSPADAESLLIARLIANRGHGPLVLDSDRLPVAQIENLAHLTLDGLCHSLWFLGHHLQGNFSLVQGNGLRKLEHQEIKEMIVGVFWLLSDWPNRLEQTLAKKMTLNNKWTGANITIRLLGPIQRYYETHIEPSDPVFITRPYEVFVRQLVKQLGIKRRPSRLDSPQLELDLT